MKWKWIGWLVCKPQEKSAGPLPTEVTTSEPHPPPRHTKTSVFLPSLHHDSFWKFLVKAKSPSGKKGQSSAFQHYYVLSTLNTCTTTYRLKPWSFEELPLELTNFRRSIIPRSIHVTASDIISFFFMAVTLNFYKPWRMGQKLIYTVQVAKSRDLNHRFCCRREEMSKFYLGGSGGSHVSTYFKGCRKRIQGWKFILGQGNSTETKELKSVKRLVNYWDFGSIWMQYVNWRVSREEPLEVGSWS